MNRYIPDRINKILEYTPTEAVYGVRLDANENPYPVPAEIVNDFHKCIDRCDFNRYPDPYAAALIKEFAAVNKVNTDDVVAGNGSDELINLLLNLFLRQSDSMAVTVPDFSMYKFYAELIGCKILCDKKSGDGGIDFEGFRSLVCENNCRVVIFSNPCNPTGRAYDRETILNFVRAVDCIVIVDEAYMEFCSGNCSVLDMCGKIDNLIVLKTLSKAYCGAGLRVGFSVSESGIAAALRKVKSPYNLNTVSQLFGIVLLKHYSETAARSRKIADDTQKLHSKLLDYADIAGYIPLKTNANFILLAFKNDMSAEIIYNRLKDKDIIVRCPDPCHLRITCGSEFENDYFLNEFNKIIEETF